jgi:hypothetical protein
MAISMPDLISDTARIVDSMELSSFLGVDKIIRLDDVENSLEISQDEEEEDIAESDARSEDIRSSISVEVDRRKQALENAYPFVMSTNGEELKFVSEYNIGQVAYLLSLLIQNSWSGGLLSDPHKISDPEFRQARKAFEVLAAVSAAGYTDGPSFHIGRNRGGALALLQHLRNAWVVVGDGTVRTDLIEDAPIDANDDGIDVISYRPSNAGPPHQSIVFAQSAAGQNWKGKSVKNLIEGFVRNWFVIAPVAQTEALMIVADLPDKRTINQQTTKLGFVSHRLLTPRNVLAGYGKYLIDNSVIDCGADLDLAEQWLKQYLISRGISE